MSKTTRILLAEKLDAQREVLLANLYECPGIEVVGTAKSTKKVVSFTERDKPDILLLDIYLLNSQSHDFCKELRDIHSVLKIVMTTVSESEDEVFTALASEANGYCLKDVDAKDIDRGLRTIKQGEFWLDPKIGKRVIRAVEQRLSRLKTAQSKVADAEALSLRELEVLNLIANGMSNQEIAEKLSISPETVKTHISNMIKKLAVKDRTHAAVKAVREGLI
ncbi:MAG TPA: response regulator transcription factor [Oculatellaceae cyanobacterium]